MKRLEIKSADPVLKNALQGWWEEFAPCAPAEYSLVIVDLDSACAPNDREALTVSYTLPCALSRPFCFEELEQKCKESSAWMIPQCDEQSFVYEEDIAKNAPNGQPQLQGKARLVFEGGQVFLDGNALALSALEFRMLEILYSSEEPISAKDLSLALWGKERASNQINVYINYLRKKTDLPHRERLIFTERKKGFYIKNDQ